MTIGLMLWEVGFRAQAVPSGNTAADALPAPREAPFEPSDVKMLELGRPMAPSRPERSALPLSAGCCEHWLSSC